MKTHCVRGHELVGANLMVYRSRDRIRRGCRECCRISGRGGKTRPPMFGTGAHGASISARIGWYTGPREANGCRLWTGTLNSAGYASLCVRPTRWLVSRLILGLDRDDGLVARHRCDNPACVEPTHLKVGTQQDNMNDAAVRRRMPSGENGSAAKLTLAAVAEIRRLHADGHSARSLGRRFGVGHQAVLEAVRYETWRHAP